MSQNKEGLIVDGWRVLDLPVKYSMAEYDEAREEIVAKVKDSPGLIALFEIGLIPAPGISDMDFWAVFDNNAESMCLPSRPTISKKTRHLMMHKLFVATEKHYRKMLYFDPWTIYAWPDGHRLLWQRADIKRDLNFEKIDFTPEQKKDLSAVYIEGLLETIYSNIPFYAKKEIHVRETFETIKDCVYIAGQINAITGGNLTSDFSEKFKYLQSNWFEINQEEAVRKLIEVVRQGILIGFEVAFALGEWLEKNSEEISREKLGIKKTDFWHRASLDKKGKNIYLNTFRDRRVFTDSIKTPQEAFDLSAASYKEIKINLGWRTRIIDFFTLYQPLGMANVLLGLASGKGLFSDTLRKDIFTNQEKLSIFRPKIFQEKIKMLNESVEIYDKKQAPDSKGKGFVFATHRFDYQYSHEMLRRKIVGWWLRRKFWQALNNLD